MDEKLELQLKNLEIALQGKTANEVKSAIDAFKSELPAAIKAQFETEIKSVTDAFEVQLKAVQAHADKLDLKLQTKEVETKDFDPLQKVISENIELIKRTDKEKFQTKAVGNMTIANVSGSTPKTYNLDIVTLPSQSVNIQDIARGVMADNGTYVFTRELAGEGAIAPNNEGAAKSQRDYDFEAIDVTTNFIAGITRYSKKMRNNLSYIVNSIPQLLRRDYYKAENTAFQTLLAAQATASTEIITGKTKAEMLINEIGKLQDADYNETNLIVVKPTDYLSILKTAKDDLAAAVTYDAGVLRVAGVQVLKASNWLPANKYYVGDWSRVSKITTEGLSLEFSETEGSNFVNNNITARIEAQVGFVVEQPAAVIYGDFTAV